jgi:uncharacterized protein YraI
MKTFFGVATGALVAALALPGAAQAQNAFTTELVNLRAGPSYDYPVVFEVPPNAAVNSHGCIRDWSWCDVTVGGYRGWMAGQYIVYAYENRRIPIYEYGPRYNVPVVTFNVGTYWDSYYRDRPWYRDRVRWERSDYRGDRGDTRNGDYRNSKNGDRDHDGIRNRNDRDIDGDGVPNKYDRDKDGDGIPNKYDRHD